MKKIALFLILLSAVSCGQKSAQQASTVTPPIDLAQAGFDELFSEIQPQAIDSNVFNLLNRDWSVITSGPETDYNSMIGSWGGYGVLFGKPMSWVFLNGSRYTLEKIKQYGTFTLTYMDSTYKDQKMILGSKSGRDTEKMNEITLHPVATPDGQMTYKEAYLVIELRVEGLIELRPENFKTEENRQFLIQAMEKGNGKNYHNMVMGEITHVWKKK